MFLTSILVLTDFSPGGDKAIARAGQIALGHGAELVLMHVPSRRPLGAQDTQSRLTQAAEAIALRLGLTVRTVEPRAYSHRAVVARAALAQLLVLPQRSGSGWGLSSFSGPDAIRLTRDCSCPVLVARGVVRRRMRQIVVGIDFTAASQHRAMLACLMDRDAQVELLHAVSTSGEKELQKADVNPDVVRTYREDCVEQARVRLRSMTQSLYAHALPVVSSARIGKPAQQLLSRQMWGGADLVVVGKRRRPALVDRLLGSTAHELLAQARCDVMVVPDNFTLSATRLTAISRSVAAPLPSPA